MKATSLVRFALCLVCTAWCTTASAQGRGVGNLSQSPYGAPQMGMGGGSGMGGAGISNQRSFGKLGGRMNIGNMGRLQTPSLGRQTGVASRQGQGRAGSARANRPQRNSSPVLSPSLYMLNDNNGNSFEGNYLLGTQPFEQVNSDRQKFNSQIGQLENDLNAGQLSTGGSGDPVVPIGSGLSTTGHPTGFMNTRSYFR